MSPNDAAPQFLFVENHLSDFLRDRMALAGKLREAGFEVHLAIPQQPDREPISLQDILVHVFYLQRTSTNPVDEIGCITSLLRLYRRLHPTLVHHIGLKPTLYGSIAARITGIPAVVNSLTGLGYLFTSHTVKINLLRSIVASILRFSLGHQNQYLIIQNLADRDSLLAKYNVPHDRVALIKGSGVNLSLFTSQPEPPGPPMVLMVSRLLWAKGVAEFVAAARTLSACGIQARFVLVGEPDHGHPDAIPESTLKRWHDAGDVEWLGWRYDVPALIAQSHIVCLPTSYGEGVPRVLLEAAASDRPIVATDTPGCREIVRHGENGLLVPVGDDEALVGAIAQLIENAPLRAVMGTRGRAIAVAEFSLEQVTNAILAVYRSLLVLTRTTHNPSRRQFW